MPSARFRAGWGKITAVAATAGSLETYAATRSSENITPSRDYLATGAYYLTWRAQNFSSNSANGNVKVKATVDDEVRAPVVRETTLLGMGTNEARSGHFIVKVDQSNRDYTVTLEVVPVNGDVDDFSSNNKKVFKFRSYLFQ